MGTQQQKKQSKLNTRKRKGQDAAKITSAPAESCIQCPWSVMPISTTALTWMVRNIPNRNTIEDFTEEIDEAEFVRQYNSSHMLMKMLYLCLALMNLLLRVVRHSSSLVTMAVPLPHWGVTSDFLSQVRESPVWISIRYFLFRLTCWLCARLDRNGTTRSRMDPLQLCGSSLWRKMKVKKGNLSLFPIGPVYAVLFVNDSAIMNQTDGHWTMTGSVKIIIMKILHSLDTATILAFDLDTSCAAVMICVSS